MAQLSLEEYIKKSVTAAAATPRPTALGRENLATYTDAVNAAISRAARTKAGYGTRAARLTEMGLGRSGYSDYIGTRAAKTLNSELGDAYGELVRGDAADEEDIKNEQLIRESLTNDIIAYARRIGREDYDEIYREAYSRGLGEEWAKEATEIAMEAVRADIRQSRLDKAMNKIISSRFTDAQAYAYAKSLGLSEEDARKMASFAYKVNQEVGKYEPEGDAGTFAPGIKEQHRYYDK